MNSPDGQYSEDPISVVEDLDPEPERGRMSGLRLDLLLGVALLLAVVLFAGWQRWRQDYLSGQYRAGQDAAGQSDWENALWYFTEAAGYADADALANGAREQIAERDRLYDSAVEYAERADWLPALRDIREAAGIQPGYKDLARREEIALLGVYSEVMGGTVVSREGIEPPGLYYYGAAGWTHLRGSDSYSRLRSETTEGGRFVYDTADEGWTQPPGMAPGPFEMYELPGRYLMSAQVTSGTVEYKKLALDPTYYEWQTVGKNGVWGMRYPQDGENRPSVAPVVRITAAGSQRMAYEAYDSTGIYTIEIEPVISDTSVSGFVMDIDPDSSRYLVADWINATRTEVTAETEARLYLAEAGVEGRRLIYTHTGGGFHSAQFSPDGRSLMLQTYTVIHRLAERQALVLIDLDGELPPRVFIDILAEQQAYRSPQLYLGSAFARAGAFAGRLVVTEYQGDHTHVRIVDPYNLTGPPEFGGAYIDVSVPGWAIKEWGIVAQDAQGLTVAGYGFTPQAGTFNIVSIPARGVASVHELPLANDTHVTGLRVSPDLFAWTDYVSPSPYDPRSDPYISVASLPRIQIANVEITPTVAFTIETGSRPNDEFYPLTVNLGEEAFAYSSSHRLHARNYAGTIDIVLEAGARYIYPSIRHTWYRDALR